MKKKQKRPRTIWHAERDAWLDIVIAWAGGHHEEVPESSAHDRDVHVGARHAIACARACECERACACASMQVRARASVHVRVHAARHVALCCQSDGEVAWIAATESRRVRGGVRSQREGAICVSMGVLLKKKR
jgi:hypothetical protein